MVGGGKSRDGASGKVFFSKLFWVICGEEFPGFRFKRLIDFMGKRRRGQHIFCVWV